jgi:hypothetical protein
MLVGVLNTAEFCQSASGGTRQVLHFFPVGHPVVFQINNYVITVFQIVRQYIY